MDREPRSAAQVSAIQARHVDIQQHQVAWRARLQHVQGFAAIAGRAHVIRAGKRHLSISRVSLVVIDHQDFRKGTSCLDLRGCLALAGCTGLCCVLGDGGPKGRTGGTPGQQAPARGPTQHPPPSVPARCAWDRPPAPSGGQPVLRCSGMPGRASSSTASRAAWIREDSALPTQGVPTSDCDGTTLTSPRLAETPFRVCATRRASPVVPVALQKRSRASPWD